MVHGNLHSRKLPNDPDADVLGLYLRTIALIDLKRNPACLLFYSRASLPSGSPSAQSSIFSSISNNDQNLLLTFFFIPASPFAPAFLSNFEGNKLHSTGLRKKLSGCSLPRLVEWGRHFSTGLTTLETVLWIGFSGVKLL